MMERKKMTIKRMILESRQWSGLTNEELIEVRDDHLITAKEFEDLIEEFRKRLRGNKTP